MSNIPRMPDHCRHCGAPKPRVLGRCRVCGLQVCSRCGNTQYSGGDKTVVHDSCLEEMGDGGFSMIKFVK